MEKPDLELSWCRQRQQRLCTAMQRLGAEVAIICRNENFQRLSGVRYDFKFDPVMALTANGHCTVVVPGRKPPEHIAADEMLTYEAQWTSTLRNDQRKATAEVLIPALKAAGLLNKPIAVEFSCCGPYLTGAMTGPLIDIDPDLMLDRRAKDPDELACLRMAIDATRVMYELAREIVRPGVNELEVFNQLQAAAVQRYGEPLTGTGNDYRSNARGGSPRDRQIEAGELYILDLGPAYRGYFSDNCRTIAVGGQPTDEQQRAWEHIAAVFPIVESEVRPGVSCRELYQRIKTMMDDYLPGSFNHHLGHGIGLFPHEAPHLNPQWDDTFQVGDVFTAEPGLYSETLRAGIRLENDYLVTGAGVELLSDYPLGL